VFFFFFFSCLPRMVAGMEGGRRVLYLVSGHKGIFEQVFTGYVCILLEFLSYHVK